MRMPNLQPKRRLAAQAWASWQAPPWLATMTGQGHSGARRVAQIPAPIPAATEWRLAWAVADATATDGTGAWVGHDDDAVA